MTTPRLRSVLCRAIFGLSCLIVSALLLSAAIAHAQNGTASKKLKPKPKPKHLYSLIVGTVWGPDDRPVYGVKVKIRRSQDKKSKWELQSDHHGEFAQRLPPGKADYIVWADLKDFKPMDGKALHAVQEVPVHIDNEERIDIGLHLSK